MGIRNERKDEGWVSEQLRAEGRAWGACTYEKPLLRHPGARAQGLREATNMDRGWITEQQGLERTCLLAWPQACALTCDPVPSPARPCG